LSTLSLYLSGSPAEQYAIYNRPDNGKLSTEKGCVCQNQTLRDIL